MRDWDQAVLEDLRVGERYEGELVKVEAHTRSGWGGELLWDISYSETVGIILPSRWIPPRKRRHYGWLVLINGCKRWIDFDRVKLIC